MRRPCIVWAATLACFASAFQAGAQASNPGQQPATIAFVNVNVVALDHEGVERDRSVLVRGDRIIAVGIKSDVEVPSGAVVIDGAGKYLTPGLTDAHVHLTGTPSPLLRTRDDFADASCYLAYGVTTVVNLSGTPTILEWRKRVEAGTMFGPTIYTSGPFVNEPRVKTPEEVERDILAQAQLGYDLIKFHEFFSTTVGLSRPAYRRMIETARRNGIPLIGHAPVNLGIEEMLQARESIAHLGMLDNIWFLPLRSHAIILLVSATAILILICLALTSLVAAILLRWVKKIRSKECTDRTISRTTGFIAVAAVAAFLCAFTYLPGGPVFDSTFLRLAFTVLTGIVTTATLALGFSTAGLFRHAAAPALSKIKALLPMICAAALSVLMLSFWVPVSWRSSDGGIDRLAKRIHDAGIFVQSTLVAYETANTSGRTALINDPAVNLLMPEIREAWRREPKHGIPLNRLTAFNQKLAGALHRNGVPIMAGTDAMGIDLVAPGSSLHRELQLLLASGLSRYEVMRSATVVPAAFLGKTKEFGTIAVGQRADLLLVTGNPLESLAVLKQPVGVMVRGRWLARQRLEELLQPLARNE
jgi:imidazolonepropionase-like amidohydrolase